MSPVGRACAVAAVVLAVITIATWNRGADERVANGPITTVVAEGGGEGAQLFRAKGCATCHDGPDSTAQSVDFPSLADAPGWAGDRRAGMSTAEYIAQSIREPGAFISPAWVGGGPTTAMPQLRLTDAEVAAIVGYLLGAVD